MTAFRRNSIYDPAILQILSFAAFASVLQNNFKRSSIRHTYCRYSSTCFHILQDILPLYHLRLLFISMLPFLHIYQQSLPSSKLLSNGHQLNTAHSSFSNVWKVFLGWEKVCYYMSGNYRKNEREKLALRGGGKGRI